MVLNRYLWACREDIRSNSVSPEIISLEDVIWKGQYQKSLVFCFGFYVISKISIKKITLTYFVTWIEPYQTSMIKFAIVYFHKKAPSSIRNSCPEVKRGILKNFAKFTGNHLCQSLFLNRVAGLRLWHRWFMWILRNFKNTFFIEHVWWLF